MQDRNAFLLHIWHIPSDGEEQKIKEKNRKKTKSSSSSSSSSHGGKVLKCKYEKFYENIFHRFYLRVVVILRWLDYDQGSIDSLIGIVSTVCRHLCMHCIHCMIYIFHFEVTRQLYAKIQCITQRIMHYYECAWWIYCIEHRIWIFPLVLDEIQTTRKYLPLPIIL